MSRKLKINSISCADKDLIVDEDTYEEIKDCFIISCRNGATSTIKIRFKNTLTYMPLHRHLFEYDPFKKYVHHKNDNDFDFRKSNLEVLCRGERQRKKDSHNKFSNRYKGVLTVKNRDGSIVYRVHINVASSNYYIGTYTDEELGAMVYDAAGKILLGEGNCFCNIKNKSIELDGEILERVLHIKKRVGEGAA